jgi:hypothetical protein
MWLECSPAENCFGILPSCIDVRVAGGALSRGAFAKNLPVFWQLDRAVGESNQENSLLQKGFMKKLQKNKIGACVDVKSSENPRPTSRPANGTSA